MNKNIVSAKKGTGLDDLFKEYVSQQLEEQKKQTVMGSGTSTLQNVLDNFHDLFAHPPTQSIEDENLFHYGRSYRLAFPDILTPQEISTFAQIASLDYDSLKKVLGKEIVLQRFLHALIMNSFEAGFNNFTLEGKDIPYSSVLGGKHWDDLLGDPLGFSHSYFPGPYHPPHKDNFESTRPRNLMLTINGDRQYSTIRADYAHYSLHGSRKKIFIHGGSYVSLEVHGEVSDECFSIPGRNGVYSTYTFYAPVRAFHLNEGYYQHCRFIVSTEENYNTLVQNLRGEGNSVALMDAHANIVKQKKIGKKWT